LEIRLYQDLLELNWNLLFSLITVLVLILILRKFFFQKVHDFMVQRELEVEAHLSEAEKTNEEAEKTLAEYQAKLADAEKDKQEIIKNGVTEAKAQAEAIIEDANQKAQARYERAQEEIEREREQAEEDIKRNMSDLVVLAAQKVIGESLDEEKQAEIVGQAIEEAVKTNDKA